MPKQRRNDFLIPLLAVVSDAAAIEAAFLASYWLRFFSPLTSTFEVTLGIPPLSTYVGSSLIFIPIWLAVFQSRKLYGARRNSHLSDEFFAIVRVVTIGLLIIMSATFFYRGFSYSRGVFILLWATSIATITIGRFLIMEFEKFLYRQGKELKTVAIVGSNTTADGIFSLLSSHHSLGYEVVGYYAETPAHASLNLSRATYLGSLKELPAGVTTYRLQAALIALPYSDHPQLLEMIRDAEGVNVELMMVPDMLDMMTSRVRIQDIEGIPFLKIKEIPLSTWNRISKRAFDVVFSTVVLLLTLPVTIILAVIIKATSRGPIFFNQERISLDGKPFSVIKFRTMRTDAEESTGPVRAKKGDARATSIGRILRRTSLDELPQLWNVLTGHMSIVGPRPERPFFVEQFKEKIPRYLERHRVKTGMTGWAQVNGLRGDAPIEERTKYDIYYVENWSLVFDMKIILKTIRAVIFGKDAY
ncbi:MAG TPA: undecaprenyl-phosphate glucose phosphotransferase [Bacteroidota bacterium]|nr:undecaprenyl-phosphate glucose phosphotransferase [Bacteroidota bacterium]